MSNAELLGKLATFCKLISERCFFVIFGGFAVDGHNGAFTRNHADIDGICYRKDVEIIRDILKQMGYQTVLSDHIEEPGFIYKFGAANKEKIFSFQIADKAGDDSFTISFYSFLRKRYPLYFLNPEKVCIGNVCYPAVSKDFLLLLKQRQNNFFNEQKVKEPEKYKNKIDKHKTTQQDIELLQSLLRR